MEKHQKHEHVQNHLHNNLIVALDLPDIQQAEQLVDELGENVAFYKIGMQMLAQKNALHFVQKLKEQNNKVFLDAKLYDIERTVEAAVVEYQKLNIDFLTVHSETKTVKAAVRAAKGTNVKILAVTVLTNMDKCDLENRGIKFEKHEDVSDIVLQRTIKALKAGAHGVIAAPDEAKIIREKYKNNIIICTPGIRNKTEKICNDDQKRINTVKNAIENGADYIIVGRPITQAKDPLKIVLDIKRQIECRE